MGGCCSAAGDWDQPVPVELVIETLSYLVVVDLTSCQGINHTLCDIIDTSPLLQHHVNLTLAGVVDNPNVTLSLVEHKCALSL